MRRKSCLNAEILEVGIQIPTLFQRNLRKQYPSASPVYEVEAVDANLNRTRLGTSFQGRKHGYFQTALG
jgi:hypothetical protein